MKNVSLESQDLLCACISAPSIVSAAEATVIMEDSQKDGQQVMCAPTGIGMTYPFD